MMPLAAARKVSISEVPVIDFAPLHSVDRAARRKLAAEVYDACHGLGFFYIVNHGVPAGEIAKIFDVAKRFFALPIDDKLKVSLTQSPHFRGYLAMKAGGASTELRGNLHEGFQLEEDLRPDDPDVLAGKLLRGPNQWPSGMPELRDAAMAYHARMQALSFDILGVFAESLNLPVDAFQKFYLKTQSQLRFLHYPPQDPSDLEGVGVRPHTDSGGFSLLAQDNVGGLEVQNRDGEWLGVPPIENSYVVNIGEMLKLWTDGVFAATPHRVINRSGKERYSVPFFATPGSDVVIAPLMANPVPEDLPVYHTSMERGRQLTCGQILSQTYAKIWPSPVADALLAASA